MCTLIVSRLMTSRNQIVVRLQAPLAPELARQVCQRVALLLETAADDGVRDVACHVDGEADVVVVDVLLRVQLLVLRSGRQLSISANGRSLDELTVLAGLVEVLPPVCLELGRQPEPGEQRSVEEVVHVGDGPV